MIHIFLEQFAGQLPVGVHAVLLWDQAGFHTANAVRIPENVTIIELPTHSPQLKQMDTLQHYLRIHYWSINPYEAYEALLDAATAAWPKACLGHALVRTVCAAPYLKEGT